MHLRKLYNEHCIDKHVRTTIDMPKTFIKTHINRAINHTFMARHLIFHTLWLPIIALMLQKLAKNFAS